MINLRNKISLAGRIEEQPEIKKINGKFLIKFVISSYENSSRNYFRIIKISDRIFEQQKYSVGKDVIISGYLDNKSQDRTCVFKHISEILAENIFCKKLQDFIDANSDNRA